jgi:heat shock protein HtpX
MTLGVYNPKFTKYNMASVYTQQSNNTRKTWLLMFVFIGLVSAICYFFSYYYNNYLFAILGFAVSIGQCLVSYFAGDKIALSYANAKEIQYSDAPQIFELTQNLSKVAGIPCPKIHISDDPSPNAFACGRDPQNASICLNQGIIDLLNKNELEGVIAHELSHIKNRDILIMTVTMVLSSVISFLADMGMRSMMWGGGSREKDEDSNPLVMILGIVALVLSPILATIITMAVSREREFLADATAVTLTRYPQALSNALLKLHNDPTPTSNYSTAMNHFYISEPKKSWGEKAMSWFSTHPPIQERVEALSKMG